MGIIAHERTEIKDLIKAWASRRMIFVGRASIADLANELEELIRRLRAESVRGA